MSSGQLQLGGEVTRQRYHGHVDTSTSQPGGARRENPISRADGDTIEPFVHPLILCDVEEGQVGSILPRPPEVASASESEDHGRSGVVAASDDVLGSVEPGNDVAEVRYDRLDLLEGRTRRPSEVLDVDQNELPSCPEVQPCVRHETTITVYV